MISSDEDSDDSNSQQPVPRGPDPRWIRPRINYFAILSNKRFFRRFRLHKCSFSMLLRKTEHFLEPMSPRNRPISSTIQLLLALRFYATGSFLMTCGDFVGVSPMFGCRIVHCVSAAIASFRTEFIHLPANPQELRQSQREFFIISGFIRVIGCIDGKHVRIQSYGGDDAELYRNRKGYFSINVQGVVNARLEFIDIVARWPGSAHDTTMLNHSRIKYLFDNGMYGNSLLLGDSGYPSRLPYLMTPLAAPGTPQEDLYNEALIRTRNVVERTFRVWSRKFAVLNIGSRFQGVEKTLNMIVATAVLHNIARRVVPPPQINPHIYDAIPEINHLPPPGVDARQHIIETYFQGLI